MTFNADEIFEKLKKAREEFNDASSELVRTSGVSNKKIKKILDKKTKEYERILRELYTRGVECYKHHKIYHKYCTK